MLEILIICLFGALAGWLIGDTFTTGNEIVFLDLVAGFIGGYLGLFSLSSISLTENVFINHVIISVAGGSIVTVLLNVSIFAFVRRRRMQYIRTKAEEQI